MATITTTPSPNPVSATAPAPAATKEVKSIWDKYGKIIAGVGYGLAFIFLIIIIIQSSSSAPAPVPIPAPAAVQPMVGGRACKLGGKRLKLKGGCGCAGISNPL